MIAFQHILFPTDFSQQNAAIVPAVKAMAKRFGSEVVVLHVIDLPLAWYGASDAAAWSALINADRLRLEGTMALDRFVAQHFSDVRVLRRLDQGDATRQIVEIAEEQHAGLIMLPTRGYGPFRSLLLGSVTAKVLHDAHCPVWTGVHADELTAHPADRWKRVLCALDSGPQDLGVLHWAAQFAAEQALELRLAHAVQGADRTITQESDPGMYDFLFDIARQQIAKMQAEAGTDLDVCIQGGSVGRVVREAALGFQSDLIVIGRGVMQKRLGRLRSSAYSIVREAPCPVMSI
jgi:nucleotide-binding universal stress UspA family protein